jgi:hypothetical protein
VVAVAVVVERKVSWRTLLIGIACISATGLFSLFFTLRYQWGADVWYLREHLFDAEAGNPARFLARNALSLLDFLSPASIGFALTILGLALLFALTSDGPTRGIRRLIAASLLLAFTAAFLHLYPIGGVRQCLYLGPAICVGAAAGLQCMVLPQPRSNALRCLAVIGVLVAVSAVWEIRRGSPYEEVEDLPAVLSELKQAAGPGEEVYVYYGARPAVEFYVDEQEREHYVFGMPHRASPGEYVKEILAGVPPGSKRIWLVFSHVTFREDQRIAEDLRAQKGIGGVTVRLRAINAMLWEVTRK